MGWHQPAAGGGGRLAWRAAALARLHGVADDLWPRHRARAPLREPADQVSAKWTCEGEPRWVLACASYWRALTSCHSVSPIFLGEGFACSQTCAACLTEEADR